MVAVGPSLAALDSMSTVRPVLPLSTPVEPAVDDAIEITSYAPRDAAVEVYSWSSVSSDSLVNWVRGHGGQVHVPSGIGAHSADAPAALEIISGASTLLVHRGDVITCDTTGRFAAYAHRDFHARFVATSGDPSPEPSAHAVPTEVTYAKSSVPAGIEYLLLGDTSVICVLSAVDDSLPRVFLGAAGDDTLHEVRVQLWVPFDTSGTVYASTTDGDLFLTPTDNGTSTGDSTGTGEIIASFGREGSPSQTFRSVDHSGFRGVVDGPYLSVLAAGE